MKPASFQIAIAAASLIAFAAHAPSHAQSAHSRRPAAVNFENQKKDDINAGIVGLAGGQLEGAPIRLASEMARAVDNGDKLHLLPIVTRGPSENIDALLYLRGVDLAIVNTDILDQFKARAPNIRNRIAYVINLFPSEAHVFVRPGIERLEDLKGRKVNFNTAGTAAAYSGPLIFDKLGIEVEKTFVPHQAALEQMQGGDIAAVFFITSKPVDAFLKKKFDVGYKFLPVPYDDRLSDYYMPASLNHADYPGLIRDGEEVQTIAAPTALVAFNWAPNTERYRRVALFVNTLFDNIGKLQGPGFDPKWKSISLSATVPSLDRFRAAQEWLDRAPAPASAAASAGIDPELARRQIARDTRLGQAEQERLLREFLRWAGERR